MAGNSYKLKFNLSDGTTKEVTFTAPQGPQGIQGHKGDKGDVGMTGSQGPKGAPGAPGKTPVRGVDYWTAEDKKQIDADSQAYIAEEMAKRGQLKPEFANSVAELEASGDKSKLYVLPDGYIYAHFVGGTVEPPNTALTLEKGVKIDSSTGAETTGDGMYSASNFIDAVDGYSYRFAYDYDAAFAATSSSAAGVCSVRIAYYDADRHFLSCSANIISSPVDSNKNVSVPIISGAKYFRVRLWLSVNIVKDEYLTLTAISAGSVAKKGWESTGRAFIPADYEGRILTLEAETVSLKASMKSLESADGGEYVPDYVVTEANRVISEVVKKQTGNTLTFLAISDMHNLESSGNIRAGNLHAGQAAKIIADSIGLDFAAMLGDISWGAQISAYPNQSIDDMLMANQYIADAFKGIDNFRTNGNHDPLTVIADGANGNLTQGQLYAFIGRYNHMGKSYFFRDYVEKKVRVIMLNTVDANNNGGSGMTPEQLLWFAQSLDLSAKSDASQWQILILSHHPLDWNQYSNGTNLTNAANILAAYLAGASVSFTESGVTNSYNFAGKNKAKIIGQIHGHLHNYKVDNIYSALSGRIAPTTAKRIAIPNACYDRNNTYAYEESENLNGIDYGEFQADGTTPLTYNKVAGTAEDTAFCVVTVDLDEHKIYAHHYGAGVDRTVAY